MQETQETRGSIIGLGRSPGEGNQQPAPAFLPGESRGQRSLAGYSSWGPKESDMTEHAYTCDTTVQE